MVMAHLGFELVEVLSKARSVKELDEAVADLNRAYPVIREQVEVIEFCLYDVKVKREFDERTAEIV